MTTRDGRNEAVATLSAAERLLAAVRSELASAPEIHRRSLRGREHAAAEAADRLREAYLNSIGTAEVSRNPFTGDVLRFQVDRGGIDGPWWDYHAALRRNEPLDRHPFALTGAMDVSGGVPETQYLVKPGPAVPYVIPRLLRLDGVAAVVSEVPVGPNRGFVIAYFSEMSPPDVTRANEWGRNQYSVSLDGSTGWNEWPEYEEDFDFDLGPCLDSGDLTWIATGDEGLALNTGRDGCPYLDLPGVREIQRIQYGEVWWPSLSDE